MHEFMNLDFNIHLSPCPHVLARHESVDRGAAQRLEKGMLCTTIAFRNSRPYKLKGRWVTRD